MTNITTKNKQKSNLSPQDWITVVSSALIIPLSIVIIVVMIAGGSSPHTDGW